MKKSKIMSKIGKILSALKFNYLKEDESDLGKVDLGVLTVGMMVAALDGVIEPSELKAFSKLADRCRVDAGEREVCYNAALHSAGYMLLVSRSGASAKAIAQAFLAEAEKVLPQGFAGGRGEDIRRALVIWITVGLSDGRFSGIERMCVESFCKRVSEIMQKRCRSQEDRPWVGLCPGLMPIRSRKALPAKAAENAPEQNWMSRAEELSVAGDLAAIRRFIARG